jgi:hypothetical protein
LAILATAIQPALAADPFVWGGNDPSKAPAAPSAPTSPTAPTAPATPATTPAPAVPNSPAPATTPGTAATPAPIIPPVAPGDERGKVAEIESQLAAGKTDEALEGARILARSARDEGTKIEAARLVADALRKKSEWKQARLSYTQARDRCEKGSDNYIKYDALVEMLAVSPAGVYPPLTAKPAGGDAAGKTLADDEYLGAALARLAETRIEKIKLKLAAVKRARSPQEAVAVLTAMIEDLRQARAVSAAAAVETERAVAAAVAQRLVELGRQVNTTLTTKETEFRQAIAGNRLTQNQRTEMEKYQSLCNELAQAEGTFQAGVDKLAGCKSWTETERLKNDSTTRQGGYTRLASVFAPPSLSDRNGRTTWW